MQQEIKIRYLDERVCGNGHVHRNGFEWADSRSGGVCVANQYGVDGGLTGEHGGHVSVHIPGGDSCAVDGQSTVAVDNARSVGGFVRLLCCTVSDCYPFIVIYSTVQRYGISEVNADNRSNSGEWM